MKNIKQKLLSSFRTVVFTMAGSAKPYPIFQVSFILPRYISPMNFVSSQTAFIAFFASTRLPQVLIKPFVKSKVSRMFTRPAGMFSFIKTNRLISALATNLCGGRRQFFVANSTFREIEPFAICVRVILFSSVKNIVTLFTTSRTSIHKWFTTIQTFFRSFFQPFHIDIILSNRH